MKISDFVIDHEPYTAEERLHHPLNRAVTIMGYLTTIFEDGADYEAIARRTGMFIHLTSSILVKMGLKDLELNLDAYDKSEWKDNRKGDKLAATVMSIYADTFMGNIEFANDPDSLALYDEKDLVESITEIYAWLKLNIETTGLQKPWMEVVPNYAEKFKWYKIVRDQLVDEIEKTLQKGVENNVPNRVIDQCIEERLRLYVNGIFSQELNMLFRAVKSVSITPVIPYTKDSGEKILIAALDINTIFNEESWTIASDKS